MESITKNRQSPRVLRGLVESAYGRPPVAVEELGHGWFNVAYRIRLDDGREVVLKIAPSPGVEVMAYERGAMATELAALRLIGERTAVPVPPVDAVGEVGGAPYFFMPFVRGDNLGIVKHDLPADELADYMALLGAANRELNSVRGAAFGPLAGPGEASWRAVFTGMLESVLVDGERRGVDLGCGYPAVRAAAARVESALDDVVEPRYVEWDLWDSNVIVRDGAIAAIIDHERAFYGDPLIEAGFTATQLPAFGDPAGFLRGYGVSGFTESEVARRRLYCLYLALIMTIETVYRGHTDDRQYSWARLRVAESMALLG